MNHHYLLLFAWLGLARVRLSCSVQVVGENEVEDITNRIVGGEPALPGEFPFFAQWGGCGASLIHPDIILTAAHCFSTWSDNVLVGAYSAWTPQGDPVNSVTRKVVERRPHPLWDPLTMFYDFMLLRLDERVDLPPVRLDQSGYLGVQETVTVIGFGSTQVEQARVEGSFSSSIPPNMTVPNPFDATQTGEYFDQDEDVTTRTKFLQKVSLQHVNDATCNQFWEGLLNLDVMVCAGSMEGGKDACSGDSGGPLLKSVGTEFVQVGLVSFGYGCALPETPGVYSRISGAYDWINAEICDMSTEKPASCFPTETPTAQPVKPPTAVPTRFPSPSPSASPSDTGRTIPSTDSSEAPSTVTADIEDVIDGIIDGLIEDTLEAESSRIPSGSPSLSPSQFPSSLNR